MGVELRAEVLGVVREDPGLGVEAVLPLPYVWGRACGSGLSRFEAMRLNQSFFYSYAYRKAAVHGGEVLREAVLPRDVRHPREVVDPLPGRQPREPLADDRGVHPGGWLVLVSR